MTNDQINVNELPSIWMKINVFVAARNNKKMRKV